MRRSVPGVLIYKRIMPFGRNQYSAFGLQIHAEFPLPELEEHPERNAPDVIIKRGALTNIPALADRVGLVIGSTEEGVYLTWRDVGSFFVRGGEEIVCDPLPDVSMRTFRLPLLGVVMGILLHRRGYFTLHASAVAIDGAAVAFIGEKRAGKSTLAAALQGRGHPLLTDDIVAVRVDENGPVDVQPSFPQIKLWPESASALGHDLSALPTLSDELDKRALRASTAFCSHEVPLRRIYVLDRGAKLVDERPVSERITGGSAFKVLISQTYAARFIGSAISTPSFLSQCQIILQQVPLFRLHQANDLSRVEHTARHIERECTSAC